MFNFRYSSIGVVLTSAVLLAPVDTIQAEQPQNSQASTYSASEGISMLNGKRLFFDQSQRSAFTSNGMMPADTSPDIRETNVDLVDVPISGASGVTINSSAQPASVMRQLTVEPEPSSETAGRIHYQARIRSSNAIRVIINGLPCDRIKRTARLSASSEIELSCIALDAQLYQLSLLADEESVQVRSGVRLLGTLIPGDKL